MDVCRGDVENCKVSFPRRRDTSGASIDLRSDKMIHSTITPHGGALVNLAVDQRRSDELRESALSLPSLTLTARQHCDLELMLNGAFSPLKGFMTRGDYLAVVERGRLENGLLWPIPIVLAVDEKIGETLTVGEGVALRDEEGFMLAVLNLEEIWRPDLEQEAEAVYGTKSVEHPGVRQLLSAGDIVYLGGSVEGIERPSHFDFENLWHSPEELRHQFAKSGWRNVIAFQTSRPVHRVHRDLMLDAAKAARAHLLLHPTAGVSKPGDLEYYARVHCYEAVMRYFPAHLVTLSLLPLAMRMAGPREALWHGIIQQNYGCSGFIVGPDDGSPPQRGNDHSFYPKYAAQDYVMQFADELQIEPVPVEERRYVSARREYLPLSQIEADQDQVEEFDDTELRERLTRGKPAPDWFSFPEVVARLADVYPPRSRQGFALFFTGLSGSGKSTLARIIRAKLVEGGTRPVTLLDGDIVRQNLSSELGFSKTHRDLNIRRIGFVANEITKNGGVAICAPIAPYRETRQSVRHLIEQNGAFIEIYVSTPLEVCEARDRKGLYAKARQGLIPEFTGISDPYDVPENAEISIDTSSLSPMEAAQDILLYLLKEGFLDSRGEGQSGT